ncbi:MAG: hypothetical protein CBCREVIR_1957 [Candidatus Burkholderia crenata]|nr:MAG: hypothetical protein CBCREVIR_1957 [Candidatus Burkholderia crenata]
MNRYADWNEFFALLKDVDVPADSLSMEDRNQGICARDPFEGWVEPALGSSSRCNTII